MKNIGALTVILAGSVLLGGCATKKYVRNTAAPIQAKVDQVDEKTARQAKALEEANGRIQQVDETAQNGISSAKESATGADRRAGEAMTKAELAGKSAEQAGESAQQANQLAQRVDSGLGDLRQIVSNLDDYSVAAETTVPFGFNRYALSAEAQKNLDNLVASNVAGKRYFIAVEGFTDATGSAQYNEALSRRRADAVVQYLVGTRNVPIYRVHMIGLGQQKPVDEAHTRSARQKNRRVEVKIYSADKTTTAASASSASR